VTGTILGILAIITSYSMLNDTVTRIIQRILSTLIPPDVMV